MSETERPLTPADFFDLEKLKEAAEIQTLETMQQDDNRIAAIMKEVGARLRANRAIKITTEMHQLGIAVKVANMIVNYEGQKRLHAKLSNDQEDDEDE